MKEDRVKISVGVITYNQEKTIRQTLESILSQVGDFDLEVVVGEDHSPDSTRAVCEAMSDECEVMSESSHLSPLTSYRKVILLDDEPNMGIMRNFARVMKACTGDYIGICAGDDYWCDAHKLEKQLHYMQAHPEFGVCSTDGYRYLVRRDKMIEGIAPFAPFADGDVRKYYFNPNYSGGVYSMPLSLLIHRDILDKVPFDEFVERGFPVEDYPMQAIMAQETRWGHLPDKTVVYRVYDSSETFIGFDHPRYMQVFRGLMQVWKYLEEKYPGQSGYDEMHAQEFVFYKEYLQMLHQWRYRDIRRLVADNANLTTPKYWQAKKMASNPILFVAFHYYKEFVKYKELRKRT